MHIGRRPIAAFGNSDAVKGVLDKAANVVRNACK
jgi:hypothetical protein